MDKQQWQWPDKLAVVIWSSAAVDSTTSWTSLLEADTGMKVRVTVESDIVNSFKRLGLGLFQLTAGFANETSQMLMATRRYAVRDGGPFPVRIVWSHSQSNSGFFVRGDSNIKTPHDIKSGTRIVQMTYVDSTRIVDALLAWAQVDKKSIVWVPCHSPQESATAIIGGRADVAFSFPKTPAVYEAEKNPHGIRWVELNSEKDPDGAERFREGYPLVNFGVIPEGGVPSAVGVWGTEGINFTVTREATDLELVYSLAKWLDENYGRYKDGHVDNRFRTRDVLMRGLQYTFIPCHDGLIKYLKEKGLWTESHERRQEKNVALMTAYCEAYAEAIELADQYGIEVDPTNEQWIIHWENYKKYKNIPPITMHQSLTIDAPWVEVLGLGD